MHFTINVSDMAAVAERVSKQPCCDGDSRDVRAEHSSSTAAVALMTVAFSSLSHTKYTWIASKVRLPPPPVQPVVITDLSFVDNNSPTGAALLRLRQLHQTLYIKRQLH